MLKSNKNKLPTWPQLSKEEILAATNVLKSGKLNNWTGNIVRGFEKEFSKYIGVKYAIAVTNGTFALENSLRALDIGPGDEVIVPSKTYIATATSVLVVGAKPIFCDIDLNTENITAEFIKNKITKKTKAIIVVHLSGLACDMVPVIKLAKKHNLKVIEDCAQAHGALYKNKKAGALGDIAAFSFCQDKIITTGGEGGMILTNSKELFLKAWSYKDHGKDYQLANTKHKNNKFNYIHNTLGTNGRMTEMQAAIGLAMLKRLNKMIKQRQLIAKYLADSIAQMAIFETIPVPSRDYQHVYYRYQFKINPNKLKNNWNRGKVIQSANKRGVKLGTGVCSEIYLEKVFPLNTKPKTKLANASLLSEISLSLPINPNYSPTNLKFIRNVLKEISNDAAR